MRFCFAIRNMHDYTQLILNRNHFSSNLQHICAQASSTSNNQLSHGKSEKVWKNRNIKLQREKFQSENLLTPDSIKENQYFDTNFHHHNFHLIFPLCNLTKLCSADYKGIKTQSSLC